jgi:rubrerythrin
MDDEQAKTIEAVKFAIQMELDGKAYYQKASEESSTKTGKELFTWLAGEEDKHRQKFEEIFEAIQKKQAWPEIEIQPGKGDRLKTLFARALQTTDRNSRASTGEIESIDRAMDMEEQTRLFYVEQGKNAKYDAEKKFYESLAMEERGHYLALVDYKEYLIDPAGLFQKMEHHSLDGG